MQVADGSPAELEALHLALTGPVADVWLPLQVWNLADLADADLWLTLRHPELDRITVLAVPGGWVPQSPLPPLGGLVRYACAPGKLGIAVLLPGDTVSDHPAPAGDGVLVRGYGPGRAELAGILAGSVTDWADQGRPGTHDLGLAVWPRDAAARPSERDGMILLDRPSVVIQVGWPRT